MSRKPRTARPPSLFKTPQRPVFDITSESNREFLTRTPAANIARRLARVQEVVAAAEGDGLTEHVTRLRTHLAAFEHFRYAGNTDAAIVAAMDLWGAFERLCADAVLAGPVDSYRRSHKPAVTDDDIRAALAERETQSAAAERLGISERQLRNRLRGMGVNRKPTTSDAQK